MKAILSFTLFNLFAFGCFAQPGAGSDLDFTGGVGHATATNAIALNPINSLSVEAWIYPTSFGATSWVNTIVGTDSWTAAPGREGYVLRCGNNGQVSFNYGTTTNWEETVSPQLLVTNEWQHVVGTYDGSTLKVFINGVEVSSDPIVGTPIASTRDLHIGRTAEATQTREFEGEIDEVRIWAKALTANEIRENMCKKLIGNETDLRAYYRFDEGSGNTVADLSTNSHNLSLSASPAPIWKGSGAHIGDTSIALYTSTWTGATLHLSHPDMDSMMVSNIAGSPAGIQLYLVDGSHPDTIPPSGTYGLLNDRYWGVFVSGGTTPSYKLDYDFTGFPGILSSAALRLFYKTGGPWALSSPAPVGNILTLTGNTSRQYALGSLAPQVTFQLKSPIDSSQITLQGWGAQTIQYSWDRVASKNPEIYSWYFDDVGGNFTPPKAALVADNGGQDTTFTLNYWRMDSILNISSLAQGQSRYFIWTVRTANGIEAAEPFYAYYTRGTIGIKEWELIKGFELFPTVVEESTISYHYTGRDPIIGTVEIMDMNGKVLQSSPIEVLGPQSGTLDIGHLANGSYLLKVGDEEHVFIGSFLKE